MIAQQELGGLRSHASALANQGPSLDEETLFLEIVEGWMDGFRNETVRLFGPVKANKLTGVFKRG
jgi:hypothetical protein